MVSTARVILGPCGGTSVDLRPTVARGTWRDKAPSARLGTWASHVVVDSARRPLSHSTHGEEDESPMEAVAVGGPTSDFGVHGFHRDGGGRTRDHDLFN